jgi:uncharacterized protein (DUF433 family)
MAPDIAIDTTTDDGAYTAERAAALSGVPKSTIHYWSRHNILHPAVSRDKVKLWSYADLFRLRIIYWLRQPKTLDEGRDIPSSTMSKVRSALRQLGGLGLDVLAGDGTARILVSPDGHVFVKTPDGTVLDGSRHGQTVLDLIGTFVTPGASGILGPDLRKPRPDLRILPKKLAGSPHIVDTRVETSALAALNRRGFETPQIVALYSYLSRDAIEQAVDLEKQLRANEAA